MMFRRSTQPGLLSIPSLKQARRTQRLGMLALAIGLVSLLAWASLRLL
jgi:hypothetical protein